LDDEKQIPFGDDNKKCNSRSNWEIVSGADTFD
jgi:hypothetical protein